MTRPARTLAKRSGLHGKTGATAACTRRPARVSRSSVASRRLTDGLSGVRARLTWSSSVSSVSETNTLVAKAQEQVYVALHQRRTGLQQHRFERIRHLGEHFQ